MCVRTAFCCLIEVGTNNGMLALTGGGTSSGSNDRMLATDETMGKV